MPPILRHLLASYLLAVTAIPVAAKPEPAELNVLRDGPALTLEQAKAMTAQELGDALLVSGHPLVDEATVGPQGMEPPIPPGLGQPTVVKLYFRPTASRATEFCEQFIATVALTAVPPLAEGAATLRRPTSLTTQVAYRWVGKAHNVSSCRASRKDFFSPYPRDVEGALDAVRKLAAVSQQAKRHRRVRFPVSIDDKIRPSTIEFQKAHPELGPMRNVEVFTDPAAALAILPMGTVSYAGQANGFYPDLFSASDLLDSRGNRRPAMTVALGGEWVLSFVLENDRIILMRMLREIPPPF